MNVPLVKEKKKPEVRSQAQRGEKGVLEIAASWGPNRVAFRVPLRWNR